MSRAVGLCVTAAGSASEASKPQPLPAFMQKSATMWSKDSVQYEDRINAVTDWIIRTGYPVTAVNEPSFHSMLNVADSKFKLPGIVTKKCCTKLQSYVH